MKAVGIKVLKAKLSEYIRMVKSGQTVLVTEHDEVVAEIRPAHHEPVPISDLAEAMKMLADKGEATLASGSLAEWKGFSTKLSGLGISSRELLDALRQERS
ncbi:MAG: hypothetical protein HY537_18590 [Deltaproteobacteria bacterium]|nr:hypothetical protein [Deltaproteobacteria bacterium]